MLRYAVVGFLSLSVGGALAQQANQPTSTPPPNVTAEKSVAPMGEARTGDRWIYEMRDEITGNVTARRTTVVTEVTEKDIAIRVTSDRNDNNSATLFDKSWNILRNGPWQHDPNDGSGVQMPLSVGKTWPISTNSINSANGSSWKRSGTSKVVSEEALTIKAGTFATFKIETMLSGRNAKDPTMKSDIESVTWYAPAINHWVKRTITIRANNRVMNKSSMELVDYGRSP